MPRYLISFDSGAMDHIPQEKIAEVSDAAHAVVREAQGVGAWVFGGGLERQQASIVATDGTITDGPVPETKEVIGGFAVVDVPTREEALDDVVGCLVAMQAVYPHLRERGGSIVNFSSSAGVEGLAERGRTPRRRPACAS